MNYGKIIIVMLMMLLTIGIVSANDYPTLNGYVTDNANVLTVQERSQLSQRIAKINNDTSVEIAILDVQSTNGESLSQYATKVGDENGVGKKNTDNGIVILVSFSNERGIFIATGRGIEGILTDNKVNRIYQNGKPYFTNKQYYQGYTVMLDSIEAELAKDNSATTNVTANSAENMDVNAMIAAIVIVAFIGFIVVLIFGSRKSEESSSESRRGRGGYGRGNSDYTDAVLTGALAGEVMSSGSHHHDSDSGSSHSDSGFDFGGFGGGGFGGGGSGGSF